MDPSGHIAEHDLRREIAHERCPERSAWSRMFCMSSGPMIPCGKPGKFSTSVVCWSSPPQRKPSMTTGLEVGASGVQGCGVARRPAADDHHVLDAVTHRPDVSTRAGDRVLPPVNARQDARITLDAPPPSTPTASPLECRPSCRFKLISPACARPLLPPHSPAQLLLCLPTPRRPAGLPRRPVVRRTPMRSMGSLPDPARDGPHRLRCRRGPAALHALEVPREPRPRAEADARQRQLEIGLTVGATVLVSILGFVSIMKLDDIKNPPTATPPATAAS